MNSHSLKSRVWVAPAGGLCPFPELTLPEVLAKPEIGVCFSGGGARAMTAAMGQLRALNHLGIIPSVRYISCVSGGSWACLIFTYYTTGASSDADLLGPVTPAGEITERHVCSALTPSQLAYRATWSLEEVFGEWEADIVGEYTSHDVWNFTVGETYLEPFGLFDSETAASDPDQLPYFSYDLKTVGEIQACNPDLRSWKFLTVRPGRPFLIVNSCFLLPQDDPAQADLLNFEYTPLTVGRPFASVYQGGLYGGGLIEPFAFRGEAPALPPDPNGCQGRRMGSAGWATLALKDRHFSITETTGTSSSAYAEEIVDEIGVRRWDPRAFYWAVNGSGPYLGAKQIFGDGGILENNGLIPLLQRGVQLAIVFINTETALDLTYAPNQDPHDPLNDPNGRCDVYFPPLFGYAYSKWPWYYPNNQVFPTSEFLPVIQALQTRKQRGEPMIVNFQHTVLANSSWGVAARTDKLWVTWCYLDRCGQWEKQLASEVIQRQIEEGNANPPSGPFQNFPNYKTMWQNFGQIVQLTGEQITLLADLACDTILMDDAQVVAKSVAAMCGTSSGAVQAEGSPGAS